MPWFKIDDKAHSHPKWLKAGNAALGLFVRAGSYSAQHLTEGIVPGVIAQLYGTAPQAAKLVKVGLWHSTPHTCGRCPQPEPGDYVIHDFFEGGRNSTRAQVEDARKRATDRQTKHREKQNAMENADENASNRPRFESEKPTNRVRNEPPFQGSTAGQGGLSQRDALETVTAPHATTPSFTSTSFGSTPPTTERRAGLPDQLADLKRSVSAAGLTGIDWQLKASQWEHTRQAVERAGIPAMVAYAVNSVRLKGLPAGASAWVGGWSSLEAPPQQDGVSYLPAVPGPPTQNQMKRSYFDDVNRLASGGNQ